MFVKRVGKDICVDTFEEAHKDGKEMESLKGNLHLEEKKNTLATN
jgi:hypothetical protein